MLNVRSTINLQLSLKNISLSSWCATTKKLLSHKNCFQFPRTFTHLICGYSLKHIIHFTNRLYYNRTAQKKIINSFLYTTFFYIFIFFLFEFISCKKSERKCLFILKHPIFCLQCFSYLFFACIWYNTRKKMYSLTRPENSMQSRYVEGDIRWKNRGECKRINN